MQQWIARLEAVNQGIGATVRWLALAMVLLQFAIVVLRYVFGISYIFLIEGVLYMEPEAEDLHAHLRTVETPLNALGEKDLCPGQAALDKINASLR